MALGGECSEEFKKWREEVGEEETERCIAVKQEGLRKMGLGSSRQEAFKGLEERL
jgi:hypothetical protein